MLLRKYHWDFDIWYLFLGIPYLLFHIILFGAISGIWQLYIQVFKMARIAKKKEACDTIHHTHTQAVERGSGQVPYELRTP